MNVLYVCGWLLFLATSASACTQTFPEWTRGRNFSVKVTMNNAPLEGMSVVLIPQGEHTKSHEVEIKSDANGVARFIGVKTGRYYLELKRLGVEVGPGTVIVSSNGSGDDIASQWPLRPAYTVANIAGRFQRHIIRKGHWIDDSVHPQVGPLAGADLTLSRVDSEKRLDTLVSDLDGNFAFPSVEPGTYLLRIKERSSDSAYPIDDYLLVTVDRASGRPDLRLQVDWTSCGIVTSEIQ